MGAKQPTPPPGHKHDANRSTSPVPPRTSILQAAITEHREREAEYLRLVITAEAELDRTRNRLWNAIRFLQQIKREVSKEPRLLTGESDFAPGVAAICLNQLVDFVDAVTPKLEDVLPEEMRVGKLRETTT